MSHETENKQCQICKGYLFEDDDIVICPECGAPHHRDCWQTTGHCGVEADHGTDRQYDKVQAAKKEEETPEGEERTCPHCKRVSKSHEGDFCPYCGQSYNGAGNRHNRQYGDPMGSGPVFMGGMGFNPNSYGGIPKDSKIEDVKVEHIAKFVGSNAHRYVPRFATLNKHSKGSWNWAAFLSPAAWCFSRKLYVQGILYAIIMLASSLCLIPFNQTLKALELEQMTYSQLYQAISDNIGQFSWLTLGMLGFSLVLNLVPRIICGRFADWNYRSFTLENVRKIVAHPEVDDLDHTLMRKGNLNFFGMLIMLYAPSFLADIIEGFIW